MPGLVGQSAEKKTECLPLDASRPSLALSGCAGREAAAHSPVEGARRRLQEKDLRVLRQRKKLGEKQESRQRSKEAEKKKIRRRRKRKAGEDKTLKYAGLFCTYRYILPCENGRPAQNKMEKRRRRKKKESSPQESRNHIHPTLSRDLLHIRKQTNVRTPHSAPHV